MKLLFLTLLLTLTLQLSLVSSASSEMKLDFREIFDEHGSIMLIINSQTGRIVFANRAAAAFYGYSNIDDMYISQINTLPPEEVERERLAAEREERNFFVFRHKLANGEIRTVEVYSYPFLFNNQVHLFSIIQDITQLEALGKRTDFINTVVLILISLIVIMSLTFATYQLRLSKKRNIERVILIESERRNKTLISNIRGMVYRCRFDELWSMEYVSDGALEITGYKPEELVNNNVVDFNSLISEEYRAILRSKWIYLAANREQVFEHEYTLITKSGETKWVIEHGQIVYDDAGSVLALEGIITDITNTKASERRAEEFRNKLHATIISVGDAVIATDIDLRIELMNKEAERLTGWNQDEAIGREIGEVFVIVDEFIKGKKINPAKEALDNKTTITLSENMVLISRNGEEYPVEDSASPIWSSSGECIGCVVVFRDNTEKREKRRELEVASFRDYLTGLFNRRYFEEELMRLHNSRNLPISILAVDVNGLKVTNDAFGHEAGDELIKTVADTLANVSRQNDVVARFGGDEFIILLLNSNEKVAQSMEVRIQESLASKKVMGMDVSVSVGWDTKNEITSDLHDVIRNAENNMYVQKAKEHISNRRVLVRNILSTLLSKSEREQLHSKQVMEYANKLGIATGLNAHRLKRLKVAAEMHDIGKTMLDEEILNRNGPLSKEEWIAVKKHSEIGARILSASVEYNDIADFVLYHHERWDGSGYPKGISGENIPLESRIICIADAFEAMTSSRAYRETLSVEKAARELMDNAGKMFDANLVNIFVNEVIRIFPDTKLNGSFDESIYN